MKRILFVLLSGIVFLPLIVTENASAQWSLGASFDVRDEDPTNGFGARVERQILSGLPVDIGLRAHFSYFNETNSISDGVTVQQDFESYDFGFSATGGISLGLVAPYVGLGIGWDNSSLELSENVTGAEMDFNEPFDESDIYWNAFAGARLSIIPKVQPFIEYRFSQISDRDDIGLDQVSRLAIGLSLRF